MSGNKDEVSSFIWDSSKRLNLDSFQDLLAETVGQIKWSNKDLAAWAADKRDQETFNQGHKFMKEGQYRGPARVILLNDMTQKVVTQRKMKSRQEKTSVSQIVTVTAKLRVSNKKPWEDHYVLICKVER